MKWPGQGRQVKKGFLICLAGMASLLDRQTGAALPWAKECLRQFGAVADVVVLTPVNVRAAYGEWNGLGMPPCILLCTRRRDLAGCLQEVLARGYEPRRTLLVGGGLWDLEYAREAGMGFFPILAGREDAGWQQLTEEGMPKLLHGMYGGAYQQRVLAPYLAQRRQKQDVTVV